MANSKDACLEYPNQPSAEAPDADLIALTAANLIDNPHTALKEVFGFDDFRGKQLEAIDTALNGHDCVVLMPTGGGKSICYQLPPLLTGGCTVVISPLISLMQDQVASLEQLGVSAASLNSAMDSDAQYRVIEQLAAGELRVLYMAPERLLQPGTLRRLKEATITLIAIDEAHCVSQWGHDFRHDYLELDQLGEHFPGVPRMALTATADERTRQDIALRLKLEDTRWFIDGFDRPNIRYTVRPRTNARQQLEQFLATRNGQAGIVYCMSRRKVEETAEWLVGKGFPALPYHAGLPSEVRTENQHRFQNDEAIIIVATIAFGMGIDKPDVRFVAHLDLPKSIEAYYQETGRAGRDDDPADAWMVYGLQDVVRLRQMLDQSPAEEDHKRIERQKLDTLLGWCESTVCRRQPLLEYFGEHFPTPCGNCDNCLHPPATWDASEEAQKLLSCIYRSGQRFGAAHVIDVLRGADTEKVRSHEHASLSTFGIGAEGSANHWRSVLRQLMVRGAVYADAEQFGALKLSAEARPVLRGEVEVQLREEPVETRTARRKKPTQDIAGTLGTLELEIWERLRACRKRLADEQGVPPYVIFHDRTLHELISVRPTTLEQMLEVTGIGQAKLKRYGDIFLDELNALPAG
jgi:ATP-dependent DNA helicase RecQ